jgi:hypothetical protein
MLQDALATRLRTETRRPGCRAGQAVCICRQANLAPRILSPRVAATVVGVCQKAMSRRVKHPKKAAAREALISEQQITATMSE